MAALLKEVAARTRARPNDYSNDEEVARLREQLKAPLPPQAMMKTRFDLAEALLKAGETEASIGYFESFLSDIRKMAPEVYTQAESFFKSRLAIAYIRLGEQRNCIHHHNSDSCIFPIANHGVHSNPEGSLKARGLLEDILRKNPDYLPARWLLCVAAMTLGNYPESVPETWRFPDDAFDSPHDIRRFPDVAARIGLAANGLAGGIAVEDFDNDGLLDVFVSSWGFEDPLRFFRNRGDGTFEEHTDEAGLAGIGGGLNLVHADYDNDGLMDVLVLRGAWLDGLGEHPNSLLRNNGDGTFTDVTRKSGLLSFRPTQTAAWFDYDSDGWLDLYIGNETEHESGFLFKCELYHNNRDGSFTEIADRCGVAFQQYVKGVAAGDFNNDGRPDLYLSINDGPNLLLRNDGPADPAGPEPTRWRFTEVGAAAGVQRPVISFPTWFWDFDNDGREDILALDYDEQKLPDIVNNFLGRPMSSEGMKLYRNRGDGTFDDVTRAMGLERALLAMGCNFGDLDNDGWLDFYVGTGNPDLGAIFPNRMFRNNAGGAFQDVTTSGGFGHLQKGHGIAFADIDNDGDQDVCAVMGGAYTGDGFFNAVFSNPGHQNQWLKLRLIGSRANRCAIGARIKLTVDTGSGSRIIHRAVRSGGSFGASPLLQEVGLGPTARKVDLEIRWPGSGAIQRLEGLAPGRLYEVREDSEHPIGRQVRAIAMPKAD